MSYVRGTAEEYPHGGQHSLDILRQLADFRKGGLSTRRASRAVSDLSWQRAHHTLSDRDFRTVWHSGHVTAILANESDAIVANQTGGVWLVHGIVSPTPLAGYTGTSLSEAWDAPDIDCLAWGPDRSQVFVGTSANALVLLEFDTGLGGQLNLRQATALPGPSKKPSTSSRCESAAHRGDHRAGRVVVSHSESRDRSRRI